MPDPEETTPQSKSAEPSSIEVKPDTGRGQNQPADAELTDQPVIADRNKLLQPSLERTAKDTGNGSAFRTEVKLTDDFRDVILTDAHHSCTRTARLDKPIIKPPKSSEHEQIELNYSDQAQLAIIVDRKAVEAIYE